MVRPLICLSLLVALPARAGTETLTLLLSDDSENGAGATCQVAEEVEVTVERTFNLSAESWVRVHELVVTAEGRNGTCRVELGDLTISLDDEVLYEVTIDEGSDGNLTDDFHLSRVVVVPDQPKLKRAAGPHTLSITLTGTAESLVERIRVTAVGSIEHGRDWDSDDFDDIELAGGDDCDDDNLLINPDALEIWYDGVDQDCDGRSDYDQDKDDFDARDHGGNDCDDTRDDTYPGAEEVWYDGIDQACDGGSDYDQDGDGLDAEAHGGTDCDDLDASKFPGARTWDEDCNFIVRTDGSRTTPEAPTASATGCTRGLPAGAVVLALPVLLLGGLRRRG